jgi:hypothetical protein
MKTSPRSAIPSRLYQTSEKPTFPAGRNRSDGPYSGEFLRDEKLLPVLAQDKVIVDLDGTLGYGSSFLEEAFGGKTMRMRPRATAVRTSDEEDVEYVSRFDRSTEHPSNRRTKIRFRAVGLTKSHVDV